MEFKIFLVIICVVLAIEVQSTEGNDDFPEKKYMNTSVDPCDDFYEYTCGNFKNFHPLDEHTLTIDHFTLLEDEIAEIAKGILSEESSPDDPEALIKSKSAYKACIDADFLKDPELTIVQEENGFPLVQQSHIRASVKYGFNDIGRAVSKYGIPMLFSLIAYSNLENPTKNLIYISTLEASSLTPSQIRPHHDTHYDEAIEKGFMALSQNDTRADSKRNSKSTAAPFDIFLRRMALKVRNAAGSSLTEDEIMKNIADMVTFTRGVFTKGLPNAEMMREFQNMTITLGELNRWTKEQFNDTIELDWVQFLQETFGNTGIEISEETEVMNYSGFPKFIYGILNLVRTTEDHVIKSYVMMRIFTHLAPDSDSVSRQYINDYFANQNNVIIPRWKYCTRKIIDSVGTAGLSFAVAYEYQLRHFNVNNFDKAVELIRDIGESFKEILVNSTWMDADSKTKALEKFDNMITILGYPDTSYEKEELDKFYENLRICKWDNYGNSIRIKAFKNAYQISQVAKRDRAFWDKSPFEVNAYYNRPNNKIIFPVAMLNPVFFGNKNRILDYGRIGAIIGHEMTHGFDQAGMAYGPDGTLQSWWTNATKTAFNSRTKCFVDEYNQFYIPEINDHVAGNITLNENIADNGGARESFKAMKKMVQRKGLDRSTGEFTNEQLFFIGFGTLWCNNPSNTYLQLRKTNDHTISKFRVNGVVSNMEEFSEAFNCPLGSNMNPPTKCQLW